MKNWSRLADRMLRRCGAASPGTTPSRLRSGGSAKRATSPTRCASKAKDGKPGQDTRVRLHPPQFGTDSKRVLMSTRSGDGAALSCASKDGAKRGALAPAVTHVLGLSVRRQQRAAPARQGCRTAGRKRLSANCSRRSEAMPTTYPEGSFGALLAARGIVTRQRARALHAGRERCRQTQGAADDGRPQTRPCSRASPTC